MAYDIQKLRQQQIFQPQDMSSLGEDYGMGMGGMGVDYMPSRISSLPPYSQGPLDQIGRQPASGPETPDQGVISSEMPSPSQVSAGTSNASTQPPVDSLQKTVDAINRIYTPETVDRDRLRKLMDSAPERNNPSWARKLVAGGIGIKSKTPIEDMEKVMYAPYNRDMVQWASKADPFLKTAELENRGNINERTLAGNVVTAQTQADRLASQERIAAGKQEAAMIRARAYDYSQRLGKGWVWDLTGPTAKKMHRDTGEIIDTGLDTGKMDEQTKIELQNEGKIEAARVTGEGAASRIAMAGADYYRDSAGNLFYGNPRDPNDMRLTPAPGSPPNPVGRVDKVGTSQPRAASATNSLETRRQEQDKLTQVMQVYPTEAKQYLKKNQNGDVEWKNRPVVSPKTGYGWFGSPEVTQAQVDAYDDFREAIDPKYKRPTGPIVKTPTPPPAAPKPVDKPGIGPSTAPPTVTVAPPAKPGIGPTTPITTPQDDSLKFTYPSMKFERGEDKPFLGPTTPQELQQRAAEFLRQQGQPVTQKNVEHAIQQGWVK